MTDVVFACDLFALSKAERKQHAVIGGQVAQAVQVVQELPHGFALHYRLDGPIWKLLTEWIDLESRCCPFLSFTVQLVPQRSLVLQLTGPEGVKAFLIEELRAFGFSFTA